MKSGLATMNYGELTFSNFAGELTEPHSGGESLGKSTGCIKPPPSLHDCVLISSIITPSFIYLFEEKINSFTKQLLSTLAGGGRWSVTESKMS